MGQCCEKRYRLNGGPEETGGSSARRRNQYELAQLQQVGCSSQGSSQLREIACQVEIESQRHQLNRCYGCVTPYMEHGKLLTACQRGDLIAVKKLLEVNEDTIELSNKELMVYLTAPWGPYFCSIYNNHQNVAAFFIEKHNINVNTSDIDGWPYLFHAASRNDVPLMHYIFAKGGDLNYQSETGRKTALHVAAAGGCLNAVQMLLEDGARIDMQDSHGRSSLMESFNVMYKRGTSTSRWLHDNNQFVRNIKQGETVLNMLSVAELLIRKGADMSLCAHDGSTAMFQALENIKLFETDLGQRIIQVCQVMIECGYHIDSPIMDNLTYLDYICGRTPFYKTIIGLPRCLSTQLLSLLHKQGALPLKLSCLASQVIIRENLVHQARQKLPDIVNKTVELHIPPPRSDNCSCGWLSIDF